ncbi:hypothetical protein ABZ747_13245 [Kitasatospora cineracea]|uniref:hypothetical protein n=1 Tax=Kitasatospora cineracea TaxID=88074 RepID=UPI0033E122E6
MTGRIPPLAGAELWQAVMRAAAGRCQCRGACGKSHAKSGGRCDLVHGGYVRHSGGGTVHLIAAPADPAALLLPPHKVAALPRSALVAWCGPCFDHARTTARRACEQAATDEPDALFGT